VQAVRSVVRDGAADLTVGVPVAQIYATLPSSHGRPYLAMIGSVGFGRWRPAPARHAID
jgi:hypothetical protein